MPFNGFISYSHAADNRLAPAIQRGLHRLAKPWHRRRALWIFRDQTGLAVTPALWSSIQDALDGSDFFVLLASPEAAGSRWVDREIRHWLATKSADKILPVITDGDWHWDPDRRDFAPGSTSVPPALLGAFTEEPLYLDLRWARDDRQLSLRHSRFRDAIAQLAAPMHGVSKDDLEGEDVRQHRRARRWRSGALATLVLLTFVAVLTGLLAVRNADRANAAAHEARRQQQTAAEQRTNAERSAGEAKFQQDRASQQQTNAERSAAEAKEQQDRASQQQTKAQRAAAETQRQQRLANEQQALANRAATEARKQQELARVQRALAARAEADAGKQQKNAALQRRLADAAAARAKAQEDLARQQADLAERWAGEATLQRQAASRAAQEAVDQQAKADQQARIAVGRRLLNQARATLGDEPDTALKLGAAADTIQNDGESHRALTSLSTTTRYAGTVPGATSVVAGPDDIVAGLAGTGIVKLWKVPAQGDAIELSSVAGNSPVALSPDGRTLAVGGDGKTVVLWNVADPAAPVRLGPVPELTFVREVTFSPDGRLLAAAIQGFNNPPINPPEWAEVDLIDVSDPARAHQVGKVPAEFLVDRMTFSPDGHTLVAIMEDMDTTVWDVTDPTRPAQLSVIDDATFAVEARFNPAQQVLAVLKDAKVSLWDMSVPAQPRRITTPGLPSDVSQIAFRSDGRALALGHQSGQVTLWDVADPKRAVQIDAWQTDDTVGPLVWTADGRTLLDDAHTVTNWSTAAFGSPEPVARLDASSVQATAFGPDGGNWAMVDSTGQAAFYTVDRSGRPARRATATVADHPGGAAAISPDLRTVVVDNGCRNLAFTDVTDPAHPTRLADVAVDLSWRFPCGVPIPVPVPPGGGLSEQFEHMLFSPDGRTLAVFTTSGRLFLFDLTDRAKPLLRYTSKFNLVEADSIRFSPDGRTLAAASGQGAVQLWDVSDPAAPTLIKAIAASKSGPVSAIPVTFSPDGHTLVASGGIGSGMSATLWDVADRANPRRVAVLPGVSGSVAFSADSHTLAFGGGGGTGQLWDVTDRTSPVRISTFRDPANRIDALSPDGHTLVALNSTGSKITFFDLGPLNTIRADPARHACGRARDGLTADEWTQYVPELPYRRTCG